MTSRIAVNSPQNDMKVLLKEKVIYKCQKWAGSCSILLETTMLYKVYQKETYSDWPTDILAFARTSSEETDCDSLQFQIENVDDRPQTHNLSGN